MKYKITMDKLLEIIKNKKQSAENDLIYRKNKYKRVVSYLELLGEINAYTDLIALIESKKSTPKLEKMFYCTIKYSCVDCPNYNKTCGGRE